MDAKVAIQILKNFQKSIYTRTKNKYKILKFFKFFQTYKKEEKF